MIINSMADAQVQSNDLISFSSRPISYQIDSPTGSLKGTVPQNAYASLNVSSVLGSGPYQVTLGYVNHSWQAKPVTVNSPDAMVTFWMAFPAGPNGPQTFIFSDEG